MPVVTHLIHIHSRECERSKAAPGPLGNLCWLVGFVLLTTVLPAVIWKGGVLKESGLSVAEIFKGSADGYLDRMRLNYLTTTKIPSDDQFLYFEEGDSSVSTFL